MPLIKGYNLFVMIPGVDNGVEYKATWDGPVTNTREIACLVSNVKLAIKDNKHPIVTIFTPKEQ